MHGFALEGRGIPSDNAPMRSLLLAMGATLAASLLLIPQSARAQARVVRGDPQTGLLYKLEAKLGKPLTFEQRKQVDAATKENIEGLATCQKDYAKEIAEITGLPADDIQGMLPVIGQPLVVTDKNLLPRIEQKLGRPLAQTELQRVREADAKKKEAMKPVRDAYVRRLADITALPSSDIDGMLPFIGAQQRPR